jgi:chromate transport protein ChrA
LLEKQFVEQEKIVSEAHMKGAVAYAQVLPGATQVALVANVSYQMRGLGAAVVGTVAYLLPAMLLMTVFAAVYFRYSHGGGLVEHMDGLVAGLAGLILANAYRLGWRYAAFKPLWLLIGGAFVARLFNVNPVFIILSFAAGGFVLSVARGKYRKAST